MGNSNTTVSSTEMQKPADIVTGAESRITAKNAAGASNAKVPRRSGSLLRRNTSFRTSMRKQHRPMGLHPRRNFLLRRKTRAPPRRELTPDEKEFLAAAAGGDLNSVRELLRNGVSLDTTDANEMTALHHASKHARDDVIRFLLDRDSNPNASDLTGGFSPLHWIIINSCPLIGSKNHVDESIIALARGGCDLNATDFNLATPLHIAAQKGHKSTIDTLVRLGANPLALDVMGRSCLQLAKTDEIRDFIKSLHNKKESVVYHVLEVPGSISRSPSPPTLPAPTKKPRLSNIARETPRTSSPTPSTDSNLFRNLPQFRQQTDSPGYPAPPPPQSPAPPTPIFSSSRKSTPEYSVVNIPLPYKYRPLPIPPTDIPSPLYRYNSSSSSPIPPPPHAIARRRASRKLTTSSSIRRHRLHQNN